ncbi:MAG TPA: phytanoyl-CoA dioxygenase family protein [Chthonomonadales bacterium]|nr:phytanoyl-CoA dioxygenase family protein [Chthonomonadales bacterium]
MMYRMGERDLEMGGPYLGMLRESSSLLGDQPALKERLEEDGYLLLRGLHRKERVLAARRLILANLDANDQIDRAFPVIEGVIKEGARGAFLGGSKALTRVPDFLDLVESPEIMGFFADLFQAEVLTYDFKWLRVVGRGDSSGAHYDICYMGRGTPNVFTAWTPLGDVPFEHGPLAILADSHKSRAFDRVKETYGRMDVDRDHVTGAFSNDAVEMVDRYGGKWLTTQFQAGDVLIFGMFTMHASLTNVSNRYRQSCDTRYQRADEPVDERWIGENPMAHYAWTKGETVTMEQARAAWKV